MAAVGVKTLAYGAGIAAGTTNLPPNRSATRRDRSTLDYWREVAGQRGQKEGPSAVVRSVAAVSAP